MGPASRSRQWVRLLAGLAIAIVLLAWALRDVSFAIAWEAVRSAQLSWLGLGVLSFLLSFAVRARRWGTLLSVTCDPGPFKLRHAATYIGFGINNVLPARAGEVTKAFVLNRAAGVPLGVALGSVVAERLLDAVAVFLMLLASLALGALKGSSSGQLEASRLIWVGAVIAVLSGTVLAAAHWPRGFTRLITWTSRAIGLGRFTSRLEATSLSLLSGLEALRYPGRGLVALAESFAIWGLTAVMYWTGMVAFGVTGPGVAGAVFVTAVVALAIAIPSSPGQFGPFEAGVRLALAAYAVPTSVIIAYGFTIHFLAYFSVSAIGLPLAVHFGLSWRRLAGSDLKETVVQDDKVWVGAESRAETVGRVSLAYEGDGRFRVESGEKESEDTSLTADRAELA